ncbi:MAG TPA: N-6 DNA methylase [Chloroflexi bacterium]|nr:N-6 DNA methylase [Chloroflexota bacterium]
MSTFTQAQAKEKVQELIIEYRSLIEPETQSEANVRANFIDPLFEILGWPIRNPVFYNREEYVRGTGFADIALKTDPKADKPLIFVEAKRFGSIESLDRVQNKRNRSVAQLRLQLPGMSVDRTREEQQAINYAYQKGMRWAILSNFEHFRLFNARRDTLVLSFDSPDELLERFEELWQLAFAEIQHGSLESLRAHRERFDIDEEYLRLINEWRLRLGQDIVSHRENRILLEDSETGEVDVYKLRDVVQRILDRLVVIRYAEDRLVIKADQLRTILEIRERMDYGVPLLDQIRHFFQQFNVRHNGALFSDHLCDRLTIDEDVLHAIILNLYDARFRAMSADIMGNTYEQYLGQTLVVIQGTVQSADNLETRKAQGSYYTPEFIVRYIVDQTLGRYLYATENGRSDGAPISGQSRKRLDDIDGTNGQSALTILDPACGSGSFLMNAFHVLEEFYASEIKRITSERDTRFQQLANEGLSPIDIQIELIGYKQRLEGLQNYKNHILERHLYGLDLDPQAAELAAVNLMLRAMTRGMRLPLILNQNIKVGNTLLSGAALRGKQAQTDYAPYSSQLSEARKLRLAQQGKAQDLRHPIELQGEFEKLAHRINSEVNHDLSNYFGDNTVVKRPFNWIVEFPEVFLNDDGALKEDGGFTFVIGNPPYWSVDDTYGQNSPDAAYLKDAFLDIWAGKSDIYYYFIRRALSLLAPNGQLGFITARYYLEAYYAGKLRQIMLKEASLQQIVDFGDYTVFPKVGIKTAVTLLQREAEAQSREANQLLFDRVQHKNIDILAFLEAFRETAHCFSQLSLDNDSWNFYSPVVAQIIQQIDNGATPLGELAFIGQGMQTGRNDVFVVDKATLDRYQIEPDLLRKNIKNQDITPYNLGFRGLYLIYPEDIENLDDYPNAKAYLEEHRETLENRAAFKRGDCDWWRFTWPLHKEKYNSSKIVTPFIAPENRFALDTTMEYVGLTDTNAIFATDALPDLRYLLALLNSRLLNFRFRFIGKAKDYRYEYFENGLAKIPVKFADDETIAEVINLSQRMLDLNFVRQTIFDQFSESLNAAIHSTHNFYRAYYNHSEYQGKSISRIGVADANAKGAVIGITVDEETTRLVIYITEETAGKLPLITLDIPDDDFRHFLLLALNSDLFANRLKQIWSRGRLLKGALEALNVPVLVDASAAVNIEKIHQLMEETRLHANVLIDEQLGERATQMNDPLAIGDINAEIASIKQKIDEIVYKIYGVSSQTEQQVINDVLERL